MRRSTSLRMLGCTLALWAAFVGPEAQAEAELRISGTGAALGGLRLVAEAYEREHPGAKVVVQPAIGSTGVANAVAAGKIDIGLGGRPLDPAAAAAGLAATPYASTPLVVAVHQSLGVSAVSSEQLAALFVPGARYPNGQRARPVLRGIDTVETSFMASISPAVARALERAARRSGMLDAATDTEGADLLQNIPGAFGASTLALIVSEHRPLVALAIDGREPTLDNLASGRYPYQKRLFAITRMPPSEPVARFVAYLRGPTAQSVLRAHGHLPR